MSEVIEKRINFNKVPEECLSHVLSLTSPRDVCISSAVSTMFKSAVDSDTVWEKFLPSDYQEILNRLDEVIEFSSKRDLYFKLCTPILIDGGKMSFQLEKSSGAKWFMIPAMELSITWADIPNHENWWWVLTSDVRDSDSCSPNIDDIFENMAYLNIVYWLEFSGKIESKMLTRKTRYIVYLVYSLDGNPECLAFPAQETTVKVGMNESKSYVRLNPCKPPYDHGVPIKRIQELEEIEAANEIKVPSRRSDGWLEIEMGEFYNDNGDDGQVHASLLETKGGNWKHGLYIYGIEMRPKKYDYFS